MGVCCILLPRMAAKQSHIEIYEDIGRRMHVLRFFEIFFFSKKTSIFLAFYYKSPYLCSGIKKRTSSI